MLHRFLHDDDSYSVSVFVWWESRAVGSRSHYLRYFLPRSHRTCDLRLLLSCQIWKIRIFARSTPFPTRKGAEVSSMVPHCSRKLNGRGGQSEICRLYIVLPAQI